MWNKLVCVFLLASSMMYAQKLNATFDVSYGIFGKIGVAKATLVTNSTHYTIDMYLAATGLAKFLSGGRTEHHISKGHIEKGLMVSDMYKVIKSYGDISVSNIYKINHTKKNVHEIYKKYKKGTLVRHEALVLDFYAKNDLLTLYFNLDHAIKEKTKAKTYVYKAVGAERQQGKVTVRIPDTKVLAMYKKELGEDASWYALAIIHQKIFSSKEGRLMLSIGKDGIANKAVLKDVIFFGDIRAVRTK